MSSHAAGKATTIPETRSDARRSTRIGQAVPLIVSGLDRMGQKFLEQTSAVTINCHGCRYPSRYAHQPGSWIALGILDQEAKSKPKLVRAQVRFMRLPGSPRDLYQVGVELETPANIWGINSAPTDWLRFPGSASAVGHSARADSSPGGPETAVQNEEKLHALPLSGKVETAGSAPSPPDGPRSKTSVPASEATKAPQEMSPADRLLVALEAKLQLAAEKAVESATTSYLGAAISQAVQAIEDATKASVRHLEERRPQQQAAAREQLLEQLKTELSQAHGQWQESVEASRARAEEATSQLEKKADETQHTLAEAHGYLQEAAQKLQDQFSSRLREAVEHAVTEFNDETARIADRQLVRLVEKGQATTSEAAAHIEARAAETRAQVESAASTTLKEFQRRTAVDVELAVTESRERLESSLASLNSRHRADCETWQQTWQDEVARLGEKSAQQFSERLQSMVNSWMVAALAAVNQQSKAVLDSLAKEAGQRVREPNGGSLLRGPR